MDKKEIINELVTRFAGGSKARFAEMLGVTPATISVWLGRNTFDIERVYAVCKGVSAHFLLTGEGCVMETETSKYQELTKIIETQDEMIALQRRQIQLLEEMMASKKE